MRPAGAVAAIILLLLRLTPAGADEPATQGNIAVRVDADFPGGNIILEKIEGDEVMVHPDLRDTSGSWFYWCFRVRGAAGRTLTFRFTRDNPIGVRGPAVSTDQRKSWRWLADPAQADVAASSFKYCFAGAADDVYFSFGMTYTQAHLDGFLIGVKNNSALQQDKLCNSRKGRPVELLRIGKTSGEPGYRVMVTARHHACEMMASYAVEGIIQALLAEEENGQWFRENVETIIIPFVDKDGVEDGDQGKNRKPRDHNRDYAGQSLYPETAAIRDLVSGWSAGRPLVTLDLHCPHIRGKNNEVIYQVGSSKPENWAQQQALGKLLERLQRGPLVYHPSDDLPFGTAWNTAGNYVQGMSFGGWAAGLANIKLAGGFEVPYANASGKEVNQESARALGRDIAAALTAYLKR